MTKLTHHEREYKMKKVLVLGHTGMLGHKVVEVLASCKDIGIDTWVGVNTGKYIVKPEHLKGLLKGIGVDVVINCIGVTKYPTRAGSTIEDTILVNAAWPHTLAAACTAAGARMIHISTDCVFSGKIGNRKEGSPTTPVDLYGRTKAIGEVCYCGHLTLRTSFIGHERSSARGLLEWYLQCEDPSVEGFSNVFFSGLTTDCVAEFLRDEVLRDTPLWGLYHLVGPVISKRALLCNIKREYCDRELPEIRLNSAMVLDRTLCGEKLKADTGWESPSWDSMLAQMHQSNLGK